MEQNPYLWILKADPARYIRTASAAVTALLKAAEGAAALFFALRLFPLFRAAAFHGAPLSALPRVIARLFTGSAADRVLLCAGLFALLVLLVGTLAEAVMLLVLRFALTGAGVLKILQRVLFYAVLLLTAAAAVCAALFILHAARHDLSALPRAVLVSLACALPLSLLVSYRRELLAVFTAIDYEFRLGFKETGVKDSKAGRDAFLLGLLCLLCAAAAAVLYVRGGLRPEALRPWLAGLGLETVKYFAAYGSFWWFLRCHR